MKFAQLVSFVRKETKKANNYIFGKDNMIIKGVDSKRSDKQTVKYIRRNVDTDRSSEHRHGSRNIQKKTNR